MLYQMKLNEEPFARVSDGQKTLELRVFDSKRRRLQPGDHIEFAKRSDLKKTVRVEVIGLLRYRRFSELIDDVPAAWLGYEESEKGYLRTSMYEVYPQEEEDRDGVVGIRFRLLPAVEEK